jgi:hypothetical protein
MPERDGMKRLSYAIKSPLLQISGRLLPSLLPELAWLLAKLELEDHRLSTRAVGFLGRDRLFRTLQYCYPNMDTNERLLGPHEPGKIKANC